MLSDDAGQVDGHANPSGWTGPQVQLLEYTCICRTEANQVDIRI